MSLLEIIIRKTAGKRNRGSLRPLFLITCTMSHANGSIRAIMYALGANGGIAIAKGFAAWYTKSGAMLAEAIHSVADCANQLLLLVGLRRAKRPAHGETTVVSRMKYRSMLSLHSIPDTLQSISLVNQVARVRPGRLI